MKPVRFPVPKELLTLTFPLAPFPITALIVVGLMIVNDAAAIPPKLTAVALEKFIPEIIIVSPVAAAVGVKDKIFGMGK